MNLFKRLFGNRSEDDAKFKLLSEMQQMADESERIYRGFIELSNSENSSRENVCGKGLYKARLHAAMFMVLPHVMRWPNKGDVAFELINVATGLAVEPMMRPNSDPQFSMDDANAFADRYRGDVLAGIRAELKDGPSLPDQETKGLSDLAALYVEAVVDSIGSKAYLGNAAERFDHLIKMGIMANMRRLREVAANL